MSLKKRYLLFLLVLMVSGRVNGQAAKTQLGLLYKSNSNIRLGSVWVLNKHTGVKTQSSVVGVFSIAATEGDTLLFTSNNSQAATFVVSDFADKVIYMDPVTQLDEVVIKENSLKAEIRETQQGYRRKSVFYTGTPHYYYLLVKPMTFIYENFKSEVKNARKFNKYARRQIAAAQVTARFNKKAIKNAIPIPDNEIEEFEFTFMPTLRQVQKWNDYELISYIKCCYGDFINCGN